MSDRDPISRQRSPWRELERGPVEDLLDATGASDVVTFERQVHDGRLVAIRSKDRGQWHLSISWHPAGEHRRRALRYPTWDEIAHARYELLPASITVVMYLPPLDEYVAVEPTTFHLHEERDARTRRRSAES